MSSKENSKSKFKQFFRSTKSSGNTIERSLRPEIERELRPEQPVAQRCKTLSELQLQNLNLDEASITRLWDLTKDLIVANKPAEYRQTTLTFYKKLIYTQYKNLHMMREHFFLFIQSYEVPEDLKYRLELLDTLTENGKDINNFEEKIGSFMLNWVPAITEANLLRPYLDMLTNLIKFNAAHLENNIVVGILQSACHLICTDEDNDIGLQCLTILEMVMSYTIFPSDPLPQCVVTLCRTVIFQPFCLRSSKIMKNLLGTQLGYYSMKMMCNILNDRSLYEDSQLLRGAIFHLNMNIFGSNVVFQVSPMFYASTVLMSFLHALDSRQVGVTFEVILSARRVINTYKTELSEIIWDILCDIMSTVADNIDYYERTNITKGLVQHLQTNFHETIDCIEKLLQDDKTKILANCDRIYDLIERVAEQRPEVSVLNLIEYRSLKITATRPQWLQVLNEFMTRFYRIPNKNICIKTIQSLVRIMDLNRSSYEEEILERVVIPHFQQITLEPDMQVREAVAKALVDFTRHCDTKRCGELLDILERLINRPFEQHNTVASAAATTTSSSAAAATNVVTIGSSLDGNVHAIRSDADICDIITAVEGLIEVFVVKIYRLPSCHAIRIFNILIRHLELHYERPKIFEQANIVRYKIFSWMLKARANASYYLGYPDAANNDAIKFSYYLCIDSSLPLYGMTLQNQRHQVVSQLTAHEVVLSANFTKISIRRACKIIVKCIESDRDFQIFQLVIKELPKVLQNKALIQGNDIEALATALFKIGDGNKFHTVYKTTKDECYALVLPAIAALVIYHKHMHNSHHVSIISSLTSGILSGIALVCIINTMTTIVLEMPESVMRSLPEVLLQMSKMSNTPKVAVPVLEFLSILSRLSNHLFTNFTSVQYMYAFAISLPYTKPLRYDHYTLSLAHHVIASWFLKSKLELRRNFVPYLIKSIKSNASMYDDINKVTRNVQRPEFNSLNEDSSNRKRSTSLTERGSRNKNANNTLNDSDMHLLMNESMRIFHAELADTFIDFLARHTYSPCAALPKRLPAVEYLLKDGHSQTWLVGHNLVTITTSGCPSVPMRNGLCTRCAQLGKSANLLGKADANGVTPLSPELSAGSTQHSQSTASAASTGGIADRRYTKVSLQHSSGNESAGSTDLTSSSSSTSAVPTTHRQTSNSSSASLEALSRRGSNPEPTEAGGGLAAGSSTSLLGNSLSTASISATSTQQLQPVQQQICARSCTGWAEVFIRRPTGNISWITRIQNPVANDCFGHDLPFSNIASLFLPTVHGGVFGPDFVQVALSGEQDEVLPIIEQRNDAALAAVTAAAAAVTSSRESLASGGGERKKIGSKTRALQRQEEISSMAAAMPAATSSLTSTTAAVDIPKPAGKRGKEALCGSVSDGEADDTAVVFENGQGRARNPVRRVNSSPEMSSSWRHTFLATKPAPLSQEIAATKTSTEEIQLQYPQQQQQQQQQQKKKSVQYTKDMRVSCEAIPEEIAGSTPPQAQVSEQLAAPKYQSTETAPKMLETAGAGSLPPKQHSADDVSSANMQAVQQSASASSLKSHVATKPPLSPAPPPLSPRLDKQQSSAQKTSTFAAHQGLAKSSSSGGGVVSVGAGVSIGGSSVLGGGVLSGSGGGGGLFIDGGHRERSKTLSTMREYNGKMRPSTSNFRKFDGNQGGQKPPVLSMNPSFIFMQLYNTGQLQVTDVPIKVPNDQIGSLKLLDLTPPFETHKIGVLYVGQGQCNNVIEMLRNSYGSTRYIEFLRSLGTLVSLKEAEQNNLFVCLDKDGADGKFTYMWKDDIVQVTFHIATLMPTNLQKDPNCNEKKKHIGNDYVNIIYNESGEEYNLNTISGQFNYACVIVEPLELNTNRIYVKARPEISEYVCHPEPKIVSDRSAPLLARQLALHANLASNVYQSLKTEYPFASNWLERLRRIKRLRTTLIKNQNQNGTTSSTTDSADKSSDPLNLDFTKFT